MKFGAFHFSWLSFLRNLSDIPLYWSLFPLESCIGFVNRQKMLRQTVTKGTLTRSYLPSGLFYFLALFKIEIKVAQLFSRIPSTLQSSS